MILTKKLILIRSKINKKTLKKTQNWKKIEPKTQLNSILLHKILKIENMNIIKLI